MPNIIMADKPSGGEFPSGQYLRFHAKECVIEENNGVTNTENYQTYLMNLSGLPGSFVAFDTVEPIGSPVNNDIACAGRYGIIAGNTTAKCYRFRSGAWNITDWNSHGYDAVAVPGRSVIVYTYSVVAPTKEE